MGTFSHFDSTGASRMVDVSEKGVTARYARASGRIRMSREAREQVCNRQSAKGDVLEVARLAGIMATKRTADLIPLCHPLALDAVRIDLACPGEDVVEVTAHVQVTARTGVEMEALTAVSVTLLTIYDMCKSIDRQMVIEQVRLDEKSGGRSGHFQRG